MATSTNFFDTPERAASLPTLFRGTKTEVPWSFETEVRRLWDFYFSAGATGSSRSGGASEQGEGAAHVAQLVEHVLGKDEVTGSIPVMGSSNGLAAGAVTTQEDAV